MEQAQYRIEVFPTAPDSRAEVLQDKLKSRGFDVSAVEVTNNYLINIDTSIANIDKVAKSLTQQVTQSYTINEAHVPETFTCAIEIGFLPGVTDNTAHTVTDSVCDLYGKDQKEECFVFSSITYFLTGIIDSSAAEEIALELHNPLIERKKILFYNDYISKKGMGNDIPVVHLHERSSADIVDLNLSDSELAELGKKGIQDSDGTRRGPLALDMLYLNAIKHYFHEVEKRNPRDIELESIAQTWSEHCKHTIFASKIDSIDKGIYKAFIKEATNRIRREKGDKDFCVSVFTDNAGGIEFDDDFLIADKVETHNSPSALDPFGGSITGIVGVNRDAIGFGMASRPIANRYGFCFADPADERPLFRDKEGTNQLLPPRRIMEGVIHGVNAGGNTSGIPTPQGFIYFDERYKGKPLVFVGTIGLIPRKVKGVSAVEKKAMPGDKVIVLGGRVGQDGIHGATFSSEALDSGSPATAVQIGDPITQKKFSDAIVKEARDLGLYNSITDNGAGGISCSVAEMARESGGFIVDLDKVPLKYPGLSPWQIWISESQERMTVSVPVENVDPFIELMTRRGVEAVVIGEFTGDDRAVVHYNGVEIFNLDMNFLHDGLPDKFLETKPVSYDNSYEPFECRDDLTGDLHNMLDRLNVAGYSFISTQYDHEVQANSVLKPLHGRGRVNSPASVISPVLGSKRAAVLSQGIYPSYSEIDPYKMAACGIDTAIRNAVSVGGNVDYMALLDNFCWCDSTNPERLWQLKESAQACYDVAVAFGTPFISGKDSMFNDFKGYDKDKNEVMISIPPTLLISSIGVLEDQDKCQTMDFKFSGDKIYVLGVTKDEVGGSEYLAYMGETLSGTAYKGDSVPEVDAAQNLSLYRDVYNAFQEGLFASCTSIERGGLGVALAKSAIAGMMGCSIDLQTLPVENCNRIDHLLFSESQGRILISINPEKVERFEEIFSNYAYGCIGEVSRDDSVTITNEKTTVIQSDVSQLHQRYHNRFRDYN